MLVLFCGVMLVVWVVMALDGVAVCAVSCFGYLFYWLLGCCLLLVLCIVGC